MRTEVQEREAIQETPSIAFDAPREQRWDLAFVGLLGYLVVEYMRLPAQYPIFQLIQVGKVVLAVSLLGWLMSTRVEYTDRSPVLRLDFALGILFFVSILSAIFAFNSTAAWASIFDLLRWVVIYFLIGRIVNNPWRLRVFTFVLLILNLKMAQFGIRGYFGQRAYGRSAEFLASRGVGAGSVGYFGNAGDFGVAMCVIWPLAAMLISGEKKKIPRLILYGSLFAFLGAILTSSSRGALVTLVITALFAWVKNPRRILAGLVVVLILLGSIYLLPEANKKRLESALHPKTDATASTRLNRWKEGLEMFASHPILGVGPGNYPYVFLAKYSQTDPTAEVLAPHSIYIQALSELGAFGTLAFTLIVLFLWRLNVRTRKILGVLGKEAPSRFEYRLSLGIGLGLLGFLLSGAFLTVLYYPHLWILMGLGVAAYSSSTRAGGIENGLKAEVQHDFEALSPIGKGSPC
jgi:O-antigen ligase